MESIIEVAVIGAGIAGVNLGANWLAGQRNPFRK